MSKSPISRIFAQIAYVRNSRIQQAKEAQTNPYLMQAMRENKLNGQLLAIRARWVALSIIAVFIIFLNPNWGVLYFEALLLAFGFLGWAQLRAAQVGQNRLELFLIFLDLVFLAIVAIVPNPFQNQDWPNALLYKFNNFSYFYVILAGAALAYSWRTLIGIGTWTLGLWLLCLVAVIFLGNTDPKITNDLTQIVDNPILLYFMDPSNPMIQMRIQEVVIFMIVACILALNGWRNNQLLLKQAKAMRERANLSRYFSPNIVDDLADKDNPFSDIRSQNVAVMFADIVGFTRMAEHQDPQKVVALLREFHRRLEAAVFDNHGTLDKFLGDGIMATFGSPVIGPNDARNAMQCARDMMASFKTWNDERKKLGEEPIVLSIGIHYGEVILGDIGSERRLEFAALGDTVNVAARLEELTRSMDTQILISDALVKANSKCQAGNDNHLIDNFSNAGGKMLRGRDTEINLWKMNT